MAINYAAKYAKEVANLFKKTSFIDNLVSNDYDFKDVKKVNIYTLVTQPLNDYQRSGTNRYGTPTELQDITQELEMKKDRGFSITVDKGNNLEQMGAKEAAKVLKLEIDEQANPEMDKHALHQFAINAGKIVAASGNYTTENIVKAVADGLTHMGNENVPEDNRAIVMGWTLYNTFRLAKEFVFGASEKLADGSLVKGQKGEFMGARVIVVPDKYMTFDGNVCNFLIIYKNACIAPKKIQDYFDKDNPQGINGHVLEGRFLYDAFVIGARAQGVYANVANGTQLAAPTVATGTTAGTAKITLSSANQLKYTTDGSDPRYSTTAELIASGGATPVLTAGTVVKAVGYANNKFTSNVAEYEVPA